MSANNSDVDTLAQVTKELLFAQVSLARALTATKEIKDNPAVKKDIETNLQPPLQKLEQVNKFIYIVLEHLTGGTHD